jgi:hypothetical protein
MLGGGGDRMNHQEVNDDGDKQSFVLGSIQL